MKSIFLEIEKCLGCRSCELACAVEHSSARSLFAAIGEEPLPVSRIRIEATASGPLPLQCHHCEDAPCVEACIAGAIERKVATGVVTMDESRCVGCWTCLMTCPFGAIVSGQEDRVAHKCDGCEGIEGMACVEACPTGALVYCEPDSLLSDRRRRRAEGTPVAARARCRIQ